MDTVIEKIEKKALCYISKGIMPGMNYSFSSPEAKKINSLGNRAILPEIEKNSVDTIYDLASMTKAVGTVTILARMAEKGLISFTDPVQRYLPKFKHKDVRIIDLITHTSGLASTNAANAFYKDPVAGRPRQVQGGKSLRDEIYDAGKVYQTGGDSIYSDIGYILLGDLIEAVYQQGLDKVASFEVFQPLGMTNTNYKPSDKSNIAPTEITEKRGVIRGVVHDEKSYSLGGATGSAGVFSNITDMQKFVDMILNDGIAQNKRFLPKNFIDMLFQPLAYEKNSGMKRSLCWVVGKNNAAIQDQHFKGISQTGFTGPSMAIDKEQKKSFIILSNRVHPTRDNNEFFKARYDLNQIAMMGE